MNKEMFMTDKFVDTNIVFDSIYSARPLHSNFYSSLSTEFFLRQLNITESTRIETHRIAMCSAGYLSLELYNSIRPLDWDNLKADEKESVLKKINKNLGVDEGIRNKGLTIFVIEALKVITPNLLNLSKSEIILTLCPHLSYHYTRALQLDIAEHFDQPPVDRGHDKYNSLITTLKDANDNCKAFKLNENQDFDILSDLVLLIRVGARYSNTKTKEFGLIKFYSRDKKFKDNFNEFKVYLDNKVKNEEEIQILDALGKIEMNKPYG